MKFRLPKPGSPVTNNQMGALFFAFFIMFFVIFTTNRYTMNIIMAMIMLQFSLAFKTWAIIRGEV